MERSDIQTLQDAISFLLDQNRKPYWEKFGRRKPAPTEEHLHFPWPGTPSDDFLVTLAPAECVTPLLHTHDFFALCYCYSGATKEILEGNVYDIEAGDLYFLQPNVHHQVIPSFSRAERSILLSIYLRPEFIHKHCLPLFRDNELYSAFFTEVVLNPQSSNYFVLRQVNQPDMKRLAEMMILDAAKRPLSYRALLFSSLIKMLALLSEGVLAQRSAEARQKLSADTLLSYLNEHYATATMESTAQYFNYNPSYFSTCIRKLTGKNFSDLLREIRLDRAAELLLHSDLTVKEAAALSGYTHMGNFYKLFQAHFGVTPKQYAQQQEENSREKKS